MTTTRADQDLLRTSLLEQHDAQTASFEVNIPTLRATSLELLRQPVESVWGSIFGIMDHVISDQRLTIGILEGTGHGTENDAMLTGSSADLEELIANQRTADQRLHQLIVEADLTEIKYFVFPDTQHWHRARVYHLITIQLEHRLAHHGNIDQLLRDRGIKIMGNPLLECIMTPAPDALLRRDQGLIAPGAHNDFGSLEAARVGTP